MVKASRISKLEDVTSLQLKAEILFKASKQRRERTLRSLAPVTHWMGIAGYAPDRRRP